MHRHVLLAAIAVAASFVGCRPELAVPAGARIRCGSNADCPSAMRCRTNVGYCVAQDAPEGEAPKPDGVSLLPDDRLIGPHERLTVSFDVAAQLARPPVVTLKTDPPRPLQLEATDATRFTFTYLPDGTEPEQSFPVVVTLVDAEGNEADDVVLGTVTLDRTPPKVEDLRASPARVRPGATFELSFKAGEALPAPARVELAGGGDLAFVPATDGRQHFSGAAPAGSTGALALVVHALDAANNDAAVHWDALTVDATPPQVTSTTIGQPAVREGAEIEVELAVSEELREAPTVELRKGAAVLPMTSSGPFGDRYGARHKVAATDADGSWELWATQLADVAGNTATASKVGTVAIDKGLPAVTLDFAGKTAFKDGDALSFKVKVVDGGTVLTPVASLTSGAGPTALACTAAGADFSCALPASRTIQAALDTPRCASAPCTSGTADVLVEVRDSAGNQAVAAQVLNLDFQPPAIAKATVRAPAVRLGDWVYVSVTFSEPLAATPALELRGSGAPLPLTSSAAFGLEYVASRQVTASDADGDYELWTAAFTDVAGNGAAAAKVGTVRVDERLPTVALDFGGKTAFKDADAFSFKVAVDEAVPAAPHAVLTRRATATAPATVTLDCAASASGFTCTLPAGRAVDATKDLPLCASGTTCLAGTADLALDVHDAAGNVALAARQLVLDYEAPAVDVASTVVQSPVVRLGAQIGVQVGMTEPLRAKPAIELRGSSTAVPLTVSDPFGTSYVGTRTVDASVAEGVYDVWVAGLTDLAGNPGTDLKIGSVTVDRTAPSVTSLAFDNGKTAYKAGDTLGLTVTASEPLASAPTVKLAAGAGRALTCTAQTSPPNRWHCALPSPLSAATDTPPACAGTGPCQGSAEVLTSLSDVAGNLATRSDAVTLDYAPPQLGAHSLNLLPDDLNRLRTVTAARVVTASDGSKHGTTLRAAFILTEAVSSVPTVAAVNPAGVTIDFGAPALVSGTYYEFAKTLDAALPNSRFDVQVTATDLAGNPIAPAARSVGAFDYDDVVPAAPPVAPPSTDPTFDILYLERAPWGSEATGGLASMRIVGNPSVSLTGLTFVAFDTASKNAELGRAPAALLPNDCCNRSTLSLDMQPLDRAQTYLAALDGAGNESAAVALRIVHWIATLQGKVAGSTAANPHTFSSRPLFREQLVQPDAVELDGSGVAKRGDSALAATTGAGTWLQAAGPALPAFSEAPALVFDSVRGRMIALGNVASAARVAESSGAAWAQPAVSDPEADGSVAQFQRSNLVFDGRTPLAFVNTASGGGTQVATWAWNGASWKNVTPTTSRPVNRELAAAVYDPNRDVVILLGGSTSSPTFGDGYYRGYITGAHWEYRRGSGDWANMTSIAVPQSSTTGMPVRTNHAMAFDLARGKAVVFGGCSKTATTNGDNCEVLLGDTWEYAGYGQWAKVTPAQTPGPRATAAMAYDPVRKKTVLFGGCASVLDSGSSFQVSAASRICSSAANLLGDVWEWDGTTWTPVTPADPEKDGNPSARMYGAMEYDPARGGLLLTGGCTASSCGPNYGSATDVWLWNGTSWAKQSSSAAAPPARSEAPLAYDSDRARVVLFGGGSTLRSDHWEFDGADWSPISFSGTVAGRRAHAMGYDPVRKRTVMFGGAGFSGTLGDTCLYDASTTSWSCSTPATSPSPRYAAVMAWDPVGQRLVLQGGLTSAGKTNETWAWDGTGWTDLTTSSAGTNGPPPAAAYHWAATDTTRNRILMYTNEFYVGSEATWEFDGTVWRKIVPPAQAPTDRAYAGGAPRYGQALAFDASRGCLAYLFGKYDSVTPQYDWLGTSWSLFATTDPEGDFAPGPRAGPGLVGQNARGTIVTFGGEQPANVMLGETWTLDSGATKRPGQLARIDFVPALANPLRYERVAVKWVAGASAGSPGDADGAVLRTWTAGRWLPVDPAAGGANTASAAAPAALTFEARYPAAGSYLASDKALYLSVVSASANGAAPGGYSRVASDYLEAEIDYVLP